MAVTIIKLPPPVYFILTFILMTWLGNAFPGFRIIVWPYSLIGVLFIVIGTFMTAWAALLFLRAGNTVKQIETPSALVITGPFKISRHPMYLGMMSVLIGFAFFFGTLFPFLSIIPFIIVMAAVFAPTEERRMRDIFGSLYKDYCRHTRRWL